VKAGLLVLALGAAGAAVALSLTLAANSDGGQARARVSVTPLTQAAPRASDADGSSATPTREFDAGRGPAPGVVLGDAVMPPGAVALPESPPLLAGGCGLVRVPGDAIETVETVDGPRDYRLHIPVGYDAFARTPLVLNFHGYARDAAQQEAYSGFVPVADREQFLLVTPEGSSSPPGWDIPGVYNENGWDDINFTVTLLGQLQQELCVDPGRVFATGMSNGAEMAALLGCRLPGIFAAVAPVAGVIYSDCDEGAVPVISFHGTDDFNVPFDTAEPAMEEWARHNGCTGEAVAAQVEAHVRTVTYEGCNGEDVQLFIVDGGGHTWPGSDDDTGGVGFTTREVSAAEISWQFFLDHPRQ
jgi:polyhydroxybutyrate depolymerase